jgi:hypothetical protein
VSIGELPVQVKKKKSLIQMTTGALVRGWICGYISKTEVGVYSSPIMFPI